MTRQLTLFEYYSLIQHEDVIISYKGPVTPVIMSEISADIRAKLASNPKAGKKVFAVFMELAQNILYYSAEKVTFSNKKDSVGLLLVTETKDEYIFSCGNMVENNYVNELMESGEIINSLEREDLRKLKKEQRNRPQGERSKGAGIGLIQVALTSGNPLQMDVRQVDGQHSFFSLSVTINR